MTIIYLFEKFCLVGQWLRSAGLTKISNQTKIPKSYLVDILIIFGSFCTHFDASKLKNEDQKDIKEMSVGKLFLNFIWSVILTKWCFFHFFPGL
jgi:hypothetical protein